MRRVRCRGDLGALPLHGAGRRVEGGQAVPADDEPSATWLQPAIRAQLIRPLGLRPSEVAGSAFLVASKIVMYEFVPVRGVLN